MKKPTVLKLLIIDDNQLYAEQLVDQLERDYYERVQLGFLDNKDELLKAFRQSWDVIVLGHTYDVTLPILHQLLVQYNLDIPVIVVESEHASLSVGEHLSTIEQSQLERIGASDQSHPFLALYAHWGAVAIIPKDKIFAMVLRIHQEQQHRCEREQLAKLHQVIKDAEQRSNILISNSKSAVAYIEDGLHIYANEPYLKMFGFQSLDELRGVPVVDLVASNNIIDFKNFLKDFEKGNRDNVEFEFESVRGDGSTFEAKLQLAAATYEGEPCLQVIIQPNNTENTALLAKKLAAAERIDTLTGLFNRRGYEAVLTQLREQVIAQTGVAGLLAIRIDNLGKINSSLGIQGVDNTVLSVSHVLQQALRQVLGDAVNQSGYLSRFNDTYFMVMLPNVNQTTLMSWAKALQEKIEHTIIEVGHRTVTTTVSVGATMINSNSPDVTALTDRVIQAVNTGLQSNNNEGNSFYLFDPSMMANQDDDALLEALKIALTQGQFALWYQPVYDVELDSSNLFEVFLRLPLADGTSMLPEQFVAIAERHHLMEKIDRWVLIRACKELKRYRSEVDANARLLVHLSSRSLTDNTLSEFVSKLVRAVGSSTTGAIILQYNEGIIIDHLALAAKQAIQLKQVGCHFGVYNFGSVANAMTLLDFVKPNLVRLHKTYLKDLANSDNLTTVSNVVQQINEHNTSCLMPFIEDPATMSAAWTVGARYLEGDYLQPQSESMTIVTEPSV